MSDIQALLSALDVFTGNPDKLSLERANSWLQDFQHSAEAWRTCIAVLLSVDVLTPAKVFAAQTLRTKVTYDLQRQIDPKDLPSLRDSIISALKINVSGPRTVIVQLCLALAGIALQMENWPDAVQDMIDTFGRDPATVPTLLQFLTLLPEELMGNTKIPVTDDEYRKRSSRLLTANSRQILELLSMYIQAPGVSSDVQTQIFNCMRSWLIAGEVSALDIPETPLFACVFEALASDELFDAAVDVICDLIHETQEVDDYMPVIQLIVPRVIALKPQLLKCHDDPEKIRGYARIFSEAGETYRMLLLQHTETFFPIVEAIGECSAYPDLDIVPITFPFWMRLAQAIGKKSTVSPLFLDAYRSLMRVVIGHLHFPPDSAPLAPQEAEAFRSFRHIMGDTLKDCCYVLRADNCLLATYEMITVALSRAPQSISWQEIEAPLFAMRSMGAEVDPTEQNVVPKIMDLIPSLPNHPRIRYAALLIVARYTEWINTHPDYIPVQLQYISAGFENPDTDVCAAAVQALRYMCQDCRQHLVDFLPTLHTFLKTTGTKLMQDDRRQIYEAIAHVISAMPMERAADTLRTFSLDILTQIHAVAGKEPSMATAEELQSVSDGLENLEAMLQVIRSFGEELPAACRDSCAQVWSVFDGFLAKYGTNYELAERTSRVLRHGLTLFGKVALSVATPATTRMSQGFETTGIPSFIWIAGKLIARFGEEKDQTLQNAFQDVYERSTKKVVSLLQEKSPREMPDVMEDYVQLLLQLANFDPDIFFQSAAFPVACRAAMEAFTMVHTDIIFSTLDLFNVIFDHDCLMQTSPILPKYPIYAAAIGTMFEKDGAELVNRLLTGLVEQFPDDCLSHVVSIFRSFAYIWGSQLLSWLPSILQQLPVTSAPNESKTQLLTDMTKAINMKEHDKVKNAILAFSRASRKARERRQVSVQA